MLLLGLDTSLQACSAALYDSAADRLIGRASEAMETGQAERVAVMVQELLAGASLDIRDLDRFAATCGPGTFTGIRIGLAFVRGLSLASGRPALGIPTLEAIARGMSDNFANRPVAVAVDARRGEVYFQLFGRGPDKPQLLAVAAAAALCRGQGVVIAGTGAGLLLPHLPDAVRSHGPDLPDPVTVARLAAQRDPAQAPPDPLYLRTPDARLPPPEIIAAGAEAAPVLAVLHAECFSQGWRDHEFAALLAAPGSVALLARVGGEPAGFVLARQAGGEAEILTIGTRPGLRRNGIARALVAALGEWARSAGAAVIFIEVAVGNVAARGLYVSCDFRETGRRKGYYASGEDALILRRDLQSSPGASPTHR
ncbi:MAG: tRNA (adenosine(37)-N6)-threonylcarbamoyltransferase complex dimerization subunit type 1 TsaB [Aestuariivirgaceae bacterium]